MQWLSNLKAKLLKLIEKIKIKMQQHNSCSRWILFWEIKAIFSLCFLAIWLSESSKYRSSNLWKQQIQLLKNEQLTNNNSWFTVPFSQEGIISLQIYSYNNEFIAPEKRHVIHNQYIIRLQPRRPTQHCLLQMNAEKLV